jgi:hypothetical protein
VKKPPDAQPVPARPEGSQPEIVVTYKPAGRETLDAIANELVPLPLPVERESSSPEIIVHETPRGPFTAMVAETERGAESLSAAPVAPVAILPLESRATAASASAVPAARTTPLALEIFEMVTYVVRGTDVARLSSENARRTFVEEHLLSRLPVRTMAEVERVDVTPWTVQGTLVVRVWCRTTTPA